MKNIYKLAIIFALGFTVYCSNFDEGKFQEGLVEINGTKLYTKVMGMGEPIIVIHGGPGLGFNYLVPHLSDLASNFRLIFYDQRASGKSDPNIDISDISMANFVEDIEELRKKFKLDKINILAHSWGGLLAIKYAGKYSHNVSKLILVDTIGAKSDPEKKADKIAMSRFSEDDIKKIQDYMNSQRVKDRDHDILEEFMEFNFKASFKNVKYLSNLDLNFDSNFGSNSKKLQNLDFDINNYDLTNDLKRIKCSTLIIHGDYDPYPIEAIEYIDDMLTNSSIKIIKNSGHFPFIEAKIEFYEIMNKFMK